MGIGHVAVGLGLKAADRRVNAGILIFAAFLADFLLGWFVWAGWEDYEIPADYASVHYMCFTFPWSHGLLPLCVWSAALGTVVWLATRSRPAAVLTGIAAVSHFLLDGLVHVKGLPVAGPGSYEFGLGLWRHLPLELTLEGLMAAGAVVLYWRAATHQSVARRAGMAVYVASLATLAIVGQATSTEIPLRNALIANWIAAPIVFAAVPAWLDRIKPTRAA